MYYMKVNFLNYLTLFSFWIYFSLSNIWLDLKWMPILFYCIELLMATDKWILPIGRCLLEADNKSLFYLFILLYFIDIRADKRCYQRCPLSMCLESWKAPVITRKKKKTFVTFRSWLLFGLLWAVSTAQILSVFLFIFINVENILSVHTVFINIFYTDRFTLPIFLYTDWFTLRLV
jgi:hypothetical protein